LVRIVYQWRVSSGEWGESTRWRIRDRGDGEHRRREEKSRFFASLRMTTFWFGTMRGD
jgi:hypothetical protein